MGFELFTTNKKAAAAEEAAEVETAINNSEEDEAEEEEAEEADDNNLEIRVVRPKRVDEAQQIASYLLNGCLVFLNLESTDKATSRRLIDYLQGAIYVLRGEFQRVSSTAFILSPEEIEISGAIAAVAEAGSSKSDEHKSSVTEGFGDL